MKSNYHERQAERVNRFFDLARKNRDLSISAYTTAKKLGSVIPMGQPILVGHHSEGAHRAHLNKIDNSMRASINADKKAEYYADKARAAENNTAISSDNPDAIELLQAKLEKLLKKQDFYKAANKIVKSTKLTDAKKIEAVVALGVKVETAAEFIKPDQFGRIGFPAYVLSNNNGVIKNTRDRIAHLEKINSLKTSEETINGVRLVVSVEDNRVQMFFDTKPCEEVRKKLKQNGFVFSYSVEAWQRKISTYAIWQAREILKGLVN